jgi:SAM-dependent methyltransferase
MATADAAIDFFDQWEHFALDGDLGKRVGVQYGPGAAESSLKLIGDVNAKRVVVLGADPFNNAVTLAAAGANVVVTEPTGGALESVRQHAEKANVRIDSRVGDFADLAFLLADTIDLVVSAWALSFTSDIARTLRQVHRILKPGATFVFGIAHPAASLFEMSATTEAFSQHLPSAVRRSWFDPAPVRFGSGNNAIRHQHLCFGDLYPELVRAGLRLDTYAEPEPEHGPGQPSLLGTDRPLVPATIVLRVRKDLP